MRKQVILVALLAVLTMNGTTIFGPATYTRTTGAPNVYDTTFAAYDTTVLCTLVVINGDGDGEHRLSAASIEFNGEEIIKERDFSGSVESITRVLQLKSENSLHLRLRSGPGDFLTLNIHRACDANVSLAVDTIIEGEACFTSSATGWGALSYSWDFDGDGETDTTTAENMICHTYETADTYMAAVTVTDEAGCTAEDDVEVIIELGYHYTFQIDSSYTPWSWTFPDGDKFISDRSISDDGSTVVVEAMKSYRDRYHDFYIFSDGTLTTVFDSVHDVTTNHSGNKLIVAKEPITCCFDYPSSVDCYDTYGNHLWGPALFSEQPVWSPDDQYIGMYSGHSFLDAMPAFFWDLLNISDWLDPQFVETQFGAGIYSSNGIEKDLTNINWGNVPYFDLGSFRNDLGGYLSYIFRWDRDSAGIRGLGDPTNDTLKIFNISDGEFVLTNEVVPFEVPDSYEVCSVTCPTINWASFDHKIYGVWGVSSDPLDGVEEWLFLKQYVCFDSIGNLLWRQYDTNRAHAHYYSESGRYLIETKVGNNGLIILRRTEDNEILFQMDYPDAGELLLADIHEHPETGNAFVVAVDKSGKGVILYPDGTLADLDMLGLRLCNNPDFAMQKDGANITFYKVRW